MLKTKIKSYSNVATDFQNKEMPIAGSNNACLAVITIDSALKKDENYALYASAFERMQIHWKRSAYTHYREMEIFSTDSDEN